MFKDKKRGERRKQTKSYQNRYFVGNQHFKKDYNSSVSENTDISEQPQHSIVISSYI